MIKPNLKFYSGKYNDYFNDMSNYLDFNPNDLSAKVDMLRFFSRARMNEEFESLATKVSKTNNSFIQRELGRYYLFSKRDTKKALYHLNIAIKINPEEPMWVYYFTGNSFNYYEKLCDNLFYTAIPKNASTSLKNFILDKVYSTPDKNPHSQFGNPFFKSHHFGSEDLIKSKKVLVTREPVERIKSYFNKNILEEDSLNFELGTNKKNTTEFYGLPTSPSFEFFIKNIWDYCLVFNDVLHHILPQSAYINNLSEYDIIVDIKDLDSMVVQVSKHLELDYQGPAPKKMVPKSSKINNTENLTLDDFLKTIYEDDYRLLKTKYKKVDLTESSSFSFNPSIEYSPLSSQKSDTLQTEDINFSQVFSKILESDVKGLQEIIGIKNNFTEKNLNDIIENFNNQIEKVEVNINLYDNKKDIEHSHFVSAVIRKIRNGITTIQDEMVKTNRLTLDLIKEKIISDKSLILTPHLFCLPFKYKDNYHFVFFAGFHSQIVASYDITTNKYFSYNYLVQQKPPVGRVLLSKITIKLLTQHIFDFPFEVFSYLSKPSLGRGCMVAAQHMGHSLWNDLTGLERLEKLDLLKLVKSFVVLKGAEPYGILEDKFKIKTELGLVRYSYLQWKEQIANCYYNNLLWIRATDNYVTDSLAVKILDDTPHAKKEIGDELTVTFGLRMENRTWINQREGWVEIIHHLSKKFPKLTVIIDGHNSSKHSGTLKSAGESQQHSIVDKENELVQHLKNQVYSSEVCIKSCIETTLIENIKEINKSDFFIAPWGAGLAKYRWVCNLPGIIMTSTWNLKSRPDIRIYDSLEYRENSVESDFLESIYIEDIGNESAIVKSELAQKHNFKVDITGLTEKIDEIIIKLKGSVAT